MGGQDPVRQKLLEFLWVSKDPGMVNYCIAFHPEQIKSVLGNSGPYFKGSPEMDEQAASRALELASAARGTGACQCRARGHPKNIPQGVQR